MRIASPDGREMSICFLRHFGIDRVKMLFPVVFDVDVLVEFEVDVDSLTDELVDEDEVLLELELVPLELLVDELEPEVVVVPLEELDPLCEL
jgi:hypothetical protein